MPIHNIFSFAKKKRQNKSKKIARKNPLTDYYDSTQHWVENQPTTVDNEEDTRTSTNLSLENAPQYGTVNLMCSILLCEVIDSAKQSSDVTIKVTNENGDSLQHDLLTNCGLTELLFTPTTLGTHQVRIWENGVEVNGSPAYILVRSEESLAVDVPETPLSSTIAEVLAYLNDTLQSAEPTLDLENESDQIADIIKISGEGHITGAINKKASFVLHNGQKDDPDVGIVIWNKHGIVNHHERLTRCSALEVSYTPTVSGLYYIHVSTINGHIKGSPYIVDVAAVGDVYPKEDLTNWLDDKDRLVIEAGTLTTLHYDKSRVKGALSTEIIRQGDYIPVTIKNAVSNNDSEINYNLVEDCNDSDVLDLNSDIEMDADNIELSFTLSHEGEHLIYTYDNSIPVSPTPMVAYCPGVLPGSVNPYKVKISGSGLSDAYVGVTTSFFVDGQYAGDGKMWAEIRGERLCIPLETTRKTCNRYKCRFTPQTPGNYTVRVIWNKLTVPGCPYNLTVHPYGDPNLVIVDTKALQGGVSGEELRTNVDISKAGPGNIAVKCDGATQATHCRIVDHHNQTFTIRIFPLEQGTHTLHVLYSKQPVAGSPFTFEVLTKSAKIADTSIIEPDTTANVCDESSEVETNKSKVNVTSDELKNTTTKHSLSSGDIENCSDEMSKLSSDTNKEEAVIEPPLDNTGNITKVSGDDDFHDVEYFINKPMSLTCNKIEKETTVNQVDTFIGDDTLPLRHVNNNNNDSNNNNKNNNHLTETVNESGVGSTVLSDNDLTSIHINNRLSVDTESLYETPTKYLRTDVKSPVCFFGDAHIFEKSNHILRSDDTEDLNDYIIFPVPEEFATDDIDIVQSPLNTIQNYDICSLADLSDNLTKNAHITNFDNLSLRNALDVCSTSMSSASDITESFEFKTGCPSQNMKKPTINNSTTILNNDTTPVIATVGNADDSTSEHDAESVVGVYGAGIEDGTVSGTREFYVNINDANLDQLSTKITGPTGCLASDLKHHGEKQDIVTCCYTPVECGEYLIEVLMNNVHVVNSPFKIHLLDANIESYV